MLQEGILLVAGEIVGEQVVLRREPEEVEHEVVLHHEREQLAHQVVEPVHAGAPLGRRALEGHVVNTDRHYALAPA